MYKSIYLINLNHKNSYSNVQQQKKTHLHNNNTDRFDLKEGNVIYSKGFVKHSESEI